ncbi:MAG: hypothetical protein Ct9H300mP16_13540 [Pseudomonadota bacterium]|nr:MAG: hypothetical protein Ct9H300mP16_13540 [Pseudomonadota bacterium]
MILVYSLRSRPGSSACSNCPAPRGPPRGFLISGPEAADQGIRCTVSIVLLCLLREARQLVDPRQLDQGLIWAAFPARRAQRSSRPAVNWHWPDPLIPFL